MLGILGRWLDDGHSAFSVGITLGFNFSMDLFVIFRFFGIILADDKPFKN
jgi:hypothetical protein